MSHPYGSVEYQKEVSEKRVELEARYGTVWNTSEVQEAFEITGFLAPQCAATHLETGIKGRLSFTHSPRFYFAFVPLTANEAKIWAEATKITVTTF